MFNDDRHIGRNVIFKFFKEKKIVYVQAQDL